jgi:hypothetical protein
MTANTLHPHLLHLSQSISLIIFDTHCHLLQVEFYEISSFVTEKLEARTSGCMFVSGVPGTGTSRLEETDTDINDRKDQCLDGWC